MEPKDTIPVVKGLICLSWEMNFQKILEGLFTIMLFTEMTFSYSQTKNCKLKLKT